MPADHEVGFDFVDREMTTRPHFRQSVLAARETLGSGRENLRRQHQGGLAAVQLCARLTDLWDSVVRRLFDAALEDLEMEPLRQRIALIPHGGYGRRDVAPYSDLDLMFLHQGVAREDLTDLVSRLMQDLYDAGLAPGHSVRTPSEAVQLARGDATIYTSLVEARFLVGAEPLFLDFRERFARMTSRRFRSLFEEIVKARREEQIQYGDTNYLLQPNIKRSGGGLRDIQLLRWLGFARFGTADPDGLLRQKVLLKEDQRQLIRARAFLLAARNEMHFHADKCQDVLTRPEQLRLAERQGYRGQDGLLPVEEFMQEYFRRTGQIRYLVSRFVDSLQPKPTVSQVLHPVFGHLVDRDYRVGWNRISATQAGLEKLRRDLDEVLRLADLANLYDKRIDHATWAAVCRAAPNYPDSISGHVAERFLSLLARPARLGELLRRLHELGVLERIVPAFRHARGLLQFNEYHKYTVDEHCIRAVESATALADEESLPGQVYQRMRHKRALHLALLLHDLGKGYPEDHSELGERIAQQTCERLGMPAEETAIVAFLVRHHLLMSHLALWRDTSDPQLVVRFAVQVGSPELLQMLYVMTCADLAAVGPGVLNSWKEEVLSDLYRHTMLHFGEDVLIGSNRWLTQQREQLRRQFPADPLDEWTENQIDALPASYLQSQSPEQVFDMLARLRSLGHREGTAWGQYLEDSGTVEYTIAVDSGHGRGIFSKLTGALTSEGLEVLSAEI